MLIKKFLIAKGNSTALVYNCPYKDRDKISKKLLKKVEQVGFVSKEKKSPKLIMMGGELCINATLAFASTLDEKGELFTSGLKNKVKYYNKRGITKIQIPLSFKEYKNIILLDGIGFIIYNINEKYTIKKSELLKLSSKYKLPAFGGIIYDKKKIIPFIYVSKTKSFVKETACGSGSIAFSIFSGFKDVIQPTNKVINVRKYNGFYISAKITSYL